MKLLEPIRLGTRQSPNRLLFGPHVTNLGAGRGIGERHVAYYARRARGGCGLIVTETASVHPSDWPYERAPLASECARGWAALRRACGAQDSLVVASLGHSGGQGSSAFSQSVLWAPSAVPEVNTRELPKVMESDDIEVVVSGFGRSAALAMEAGLDGVEINAGQHSLVRQFVSALSNQRHDEYGADRLRFAREVLGAARSALGDGVLGLRLCVDELAPWAGITPAAAVGLAGALAGLVDYLVVVRGSLYSVSATRPDAHVEPGFNLAVASSIRDRVGPSVPVFAQGSIVDVDMAERALCDGTADGVEMTRAQIADPDLVSKLAANRAVEIRPCLLCNQNCQVQDHRNPVVSCAVEPSSGHETEDPDLDGAAPRRLEVLVVGGGPGGLEAARVAAGRGHRVRLVEQRPALGGCLRHAAAGYGRGRLTIAVDWLAAECRRLGVTIETGSRVDAARIAAHDGPVVVCTGSVVGPRDYEIEDRARVVSADALLAEIADGGSLPAGPVVVWDPIGGPIGISVAELLARRPDGGVRPPTTTLVFPDPIPGTHLDRTGDLVSANQRLQSAGVQLHGHSRLRRAGAGEVVVDRRYGIPSTALVADVVVDAGHRHPEASLAGGPWSARAGDAVAPRTIYEAILEGRRAILAIEALGDGDDRTGARLSTTSSAIGAGDGEDSNTPTASWSMHLRNGRGIKKGRSMSSAGSERAGFTSRYRHLFSPLRLGPVTVRNRVVFSAHLTNYAVDGLPSAEHVAYYEARAAGGAGLIVTEEHSTHPSDRAYEKLIQGFRPEVLAGYRRITDAVHGHGVPIFAQLNHNGGQASSMYSRQTLWAPSPTADPAFREVAKAIDSEEIATLVAGYADVAARCRDGGFDGVELQCSHSSIIGRFLSPATNRRVDAYGGSQQRRARLLLEVLAAVRDSIGTELALGIRLCGEELIEGGVTLDEAVAVAKLVEATGHADYLNTSIGVATSSLYMIQASMAVRPGYALFVSAALRQAVDLPVVGVGRFTQPGQADCAIADGHADLVGVVRGQIADPDFAVKAHADQADEIRVCLSCNQECVGRVGLNRGLGCLENPAAGRQSPSPTRVSRGRGRRVMVVGGGPAGLQAGIAAARAGHEVTVYEAAPVAGGQIRTAAHAPGRTELGHLITNQLSECRRWGAAIVTGVKVDADDVLARTPEVVIVATGARPQRPVWVQSSLVPTGPVVVDVSAVLDGEVDPRGRVLVVDELGFHQAPSVAEVLADRGCTVRIVAPAMVVGQDLGLTLDRELWWERAIRKGIVQSPDVLVTGLIDGGVSVRHLATGAPGSIGADWVVLAAQLAPVDDLYFELKDRFRTVGGPAVHRIGDCLAPRRAHAAVIEGERVGAGL